MLKHLLLLAALLALLIPGALADDRNPTIAVLRFGSTLGARLGTAEAAVADVLQAYGFLSEEERLLLNSRQNLDGENINIAFGDAGYDFAKIGLIVDLALDQLPDALISSSTPVTQAALHATSDMDDPPPVIFVQVVNPREAGIAQSACVKPAHVTGVEASAAYEGVLPLLLLQDPDLRTIGVLFNSAEAGSAAGAKGIAEHAMALGLTVEQSAVTSLVDLRPATQALVNKGVEVILLPFDETTMGGMPIIASVANENGIPIFHSNANATAVGAMVGAGYNLFFEQGLNAGHILVAYLNGEIDIASTGVDSFSGMGVRLNLDVAAELGLDIADELKDMSEAQVEGGQVQIAPERMMELVQSLGVGPGDMPNLIQLLRESLASLVEEGAVRSPMSDITVAALQMDSAQASWQAKLESLHCSDEMIAEQQAALDASE